MEEEGSRKTPSSAARVVHAPPLHGGSDGFGVCISVLVSLARPPPPFMYRSFYVDEVFFAMLCSWMYVLFQIYGFYGL